MNCPKCGLDSDNVMMEEILPCKDCNCMNRMTYHLCSCKVMWRALNNEVIEGSFTDLGDMVESGAFLEAAGDSLGFFDSVKEDLMKQVRVSTGEAAMSDFIHKCLHCNSIALPITDSAYRCTSCDFEWEIKSIE